MADGPTVVAVCGSLREQSHTRTACRHALAAAEDEGGQGTLVDLRTFDLPVFDPDNEDAGDAPELRRTLRTADSIILGSPMYHGSYSSPMKTVLDYSGFDEFAGTTVGLLGISGGSFPITTLEHLRSVCRALDAWVLPFQAAVPNASSQFDGGEFVDQSLADRVGTLGRRVVEYASITGDPHTFESESNVGGAD